MNKEHFLIELKIYLKPLSNQQQLFILNKYDALFTQRIAAGEVEEQIAKDLGKPKNIAEEILKEFDIPIPEKKMEQNDWQEIPPATSNSYSYEDTTHPYDDTSQHYQRPHHSPFVRFCQITGILALNALFMFWVIFTIVMFFFAFWLMAGAFLFSPILGGFSVIAGLNDATLFQLFLSIFLFGAGVIGCIILTPLTKGFGKILRRYLQWTIQVLRGEI